MCWQLDNPPNDSPNEIFRFSTSAFLQHSGQHNQLPSLLTNHHCPCLALVVYQLDGCKPYHFSSCVWFHTPLGHSPHCEHIHLSEVYTWLCDSPFKTRSEAPPPQGEWPTFEAWPPKLGRTGPRQTHFCAFQTHALCSGFLAYVSNMRFCSWHSLDLKCSALHPIPSRQPKLVLAKSVQTSLTLRWGTSFYVSVLNLLIPLYMILLKHLFFSIHSVN